MRTRLKQLWDDLKAALFLVYKYITRGNRGTMILPIIVVCLSFIEINFLPGVLGGAVNSVYDQSKTNYVSDIVIQPGKDEWGNNETYLKQVNDLKRKINAIPGVITCTARYSTGAIIAYDPDKTGKDVRTISWPVKSIDPWENTRISKIAEHMAAGEYLDESDRDQIIMGKEISGGFGSALEIQSLKGARVGDEVTVYYHNGIVRKYTIKGIFNTVFPLSDLNVYITNKEMESVLGVHDRASEILIKTDASYTEEYYYDQIRKAGIELPDVKSWQSFIGMFMGIAQTFEIIKGIVAVIGLVVAGITIFIVIYIVTTSRKKQIGIMKAIGMKVSILVASYVFLALFYAIVGISMGLCILEFVLKPYFIAHPFKFPVGDVALQITQEQIITSAVSMLLVCIVAGFIPSWRVTRENIIKAIWG